MFKTPLKGGCRHSSVGLPLFESACPRELQWIDLIHRGSSKLELHLSTPKSKHYCGLGTSARSKSCNIIIMRNKISALGFTGSHFLSNIPILSGLLDEFLSTATCRRSVFQSTARKSPESEPVDQETRPALKQSSTNKQWVGKILQKK